MLGLPIAALAAVLAAMPQSPGEPPQPGDQQPASSPSRVTGGFDVAANSAFVWRGFVLCDSLVVQPAAWVGWGPFTVTSWSNVARTGPNGRRWTEHDLTVDYTAVRGDYTVSAGWINYAFLDQQSNRFSNELYVGVSRAGPVEPSLRVFQDVHAGSGTYLVAGIAYSHELQASGVTLTSTLSVGYNHRLWIDASGLSDANVVFEASIPTPFHGLVVRPGVGYSRAFRLPGLSSRVYWGLVASLELP